MTDLEFLKLYHSVDDDTRASVDLLLREGQSLRESQEKQYDIDRVVCDPHYLYREAGEHTPYPVQSQQ